MAQEIEVKLEANAGAARRLLDAAWLKRLETAPARREHLVSVYYDTRKRALRRNGISLRVRRIGERRVQTMKAGPRGGCGPFCREEYEREIGDSQPDLAIVEGRALKRFKRKKLQRKLQPLFATDIERLAVPVRSHGSEIELAIDRGQVQARRKHAPIAEIELELKRGDPAALTWLARRVAEATAASFGAMSKAERGYALVDDGAQRPVGAREIPLETGLDSGEAFKRIGLACLYHFAANRAAIAAGDAEGVHQMRIGLRRLRAAMSFFKALLPDAESRRVKRGLKWLLGELAPARDLDVLISESVQPLQQQRVDGAGLAALKGDLVQRRRGGMARARAAVVSERYRKTVLDTALWLAGGAWTTSDAPAHAALRAREVRDFAAVELARRHRKIAKKVRKIETLAPQRRHKLRIAVKKLRYADEFFASLYSGGAPKRLKRHAKRLKALQSVLGKLNDMRAHDRMAGDFVRAKRSGPKKPQRAFAMGLIAGEDHAQAQALITAAGKAGKDLKHAKPFWR